MDRAAFEKSSVQPDIVNRRTHLARQRAASAPKSPLIHPVGSSGDPSHFVGTRKSVPLPDPSNFPDPYPMHSHHPIPPLSSAGSSSASTRSSGYTNPGSTISTGVVSGDYSNVRVATDSAAELDFGIVANEVADLLAEDSGISFSSNTYESTNFPGNFERQRSGTTSDATALSTFYQQPTTQQLKKQSSYDLSWQHAVRSRSAFSFGGMSEDETDGEQNYTEGENLGDDDDDDNEDDNDNEEERTRAIILAEAGRGMIVQCEGGSVIGLPVQPG